MLRLASLLLLAGVAACSELAAPVPSNGLDPNHGPALAVTPAPTEADALAISQNIQQHHWPYLTLLNPQYASGDPASSDFHTVVHYTQAADNAIWTGHYLASEAFRYSATKSPEALTNALRALDGIEALIAVTGTNLLARTVIPQSSPHLPRILEEEKKHGSYTGTHGGQTYVWLANTSRDQYSGVFFGLGVAYDYIDDGPMRERIRLAVGRLLDFLLANGWSVKMPDGTTSTTFVGRSDQQLSFLQVGRRVDPAKYDARYKSARKSQASSVINPISYECLDPHGSYYKFNLDHINLYNLIRLEEAGTYRTTYLKAFDKLRSCTKSHQNAHFNMIERALKGAEAARDAETRELLGLWLLRPRRDYFVDNSGKYAACGTNRSCTPIRVDERYTTDFLWQRSPFQLWGGEQGTKATPGVDYILPYWMARIHGVLTS